VLNEIPEFEDFYVVYLKDDPAKEPILVGDSSPVSLADASRKTGRPKQDFELRRDQPERVRDLKEVLRLSSSERGVGYREIASTKPLGRMPRLGVLNPE
jgi:hypothetical protein